MTEARKLYFILWMACLAGYGWLYYTFNHLTETVGVCLFKQATHIPCPSCGTTRAVISLTQGHFSETFLVNPLGYLVAGIMLIAPLWMLADRLWRRQTLYKFYRRFELTVKQPRYAVPLILLMLVNWIWTISKGL